MDCRGDAAGMSQWILNQITTQVLARVSLLTKCSRGPVTPAVLHSVPLVYPRDGFTGFVYYEV